MAAAAFQRRSRGPRASRIGDARYQRRIMGFTLTDLANKLDEKDGGRNGIPMGNGSPAYGGSAQRLLRLLVCEALHEEALVTLPPETYPV